MFFVIGIIFGLLLLFGGIRVFIKESRGYRDGAITSISFGCIVLVGFLSVFLFSQMFSLHENTILLVMEENIEAYRQTTVYMNDVAVVSGGSNGLLQNFAQSSRVSHCMVEYRDMVVEYNKAISYRKVVQDNFWIGIFVVKLPLEIETIEFYLKQEHQY
jgi:hypothetical protein